MSWLPCSGCGARSEQTSRSGAQGVHKDHLAVFNPFTTDLSISCPFSSEASWTLSSSAYIVSLFVSSVSALRRTSAVHVYWLNNGELIYIRQNAELFTTDRFRVLFYAVYREELDAFGNGSNNCNFLIFYGWRFGDTLSCRPCRLWLGLNDNCSSSTSA